MVCKSFDKESKVSGVNDKIKQNQHPLDTATYQLAEELHKTIITVYSGSKDNIWSADLADLQLLSKFNKERRFLLCVIDIFSKYAWVGC